MPKELLRVVLLGKTGAGKSSTGNTLLGRDAFRVARGLSSGTERCQWADEEKEDVVLQVTDTPGLCDTHRGEEEVLREVGKSVAVARPGPHVVLIVLRCDSRFTEEEFGAYQSLKVLFGENIKKHMIVIFVGIDTYGDTLEEQNRGFEKEIKGVSGHAKEVLQDAGNRFFGINNKASWEDRERQSQTLISMMLDLVKRNGEKYFQNSFSDEVGQLVQPLVEDHMKSRQVPMMEAMRDVTIAIVENDSILPDFLQNLIRIVKEKLVPSFFRTAQTVADVAEGVGSVAREVSQCSVM